MAGRKNISSADSDLFRRSIGTVNRIRQRTSVHTPARSPKTYNPSPARQETANDSDNYPPASTQLGMGDVMNFRRPGIQQRTLNRLKKGQIAVEEELDLHGMTCEAARKRLLPFLDMCMQEGIRCIRVIHGKGRGSRDGKPVIKNLLNSLLKEYSHVLAFTSAPVSDGGTGTLYVLLRKPQRNHLSGGAG